MKLIKLYVDKKYFSNMLISHLNGFDFFDSFLIMSHIDFAQQCLTGDNFAVLSTNLYQHKSLM